jgi:membrane-associated phospholipid phosphatase
MEGDLRLASSSEVSDPTRLGATWLHGSWVLGPEPGPSPYYRAWLPLVVLGAVAAALELGVDPPREPRWEERNSFDSELRDALKGGSRSARESADTASDVIVGALGLTLLGDAVWLRNEYPFLRTVGVDMSWFLADTAATRVAKVSAGRERPFVRPCRSDSNYVSDCDAGRGQNASFFSGHASDSATLAGLLCARHLNRERRTALDWLICTGSATGSVATGLLRVTADQHFATDVITGWGFGLIFGYVLPSIYDYSHQTRADAPDPTLSLRNLTPFVVPGAKGLQYSIRF